MAWERFNADVGEVARYVQLSVAASDSGASPAVHAQVTILADRLGLTPKAMRAMLWVVASDEVGEARQEAAAAVVAPSVDKAAQVRARIKAV